MRRRTFFFKLPPGLIRVLAAGMFLFSCAVSPPAAQKVDNSEPIPAPVLRPVTDLPTADRSGYRDPQSLSGLFERVLPSVVVILTEERKPSKDRLGEEEVENSIGTGFIVSQDGLIMTASHMIEVVDRIVVRFKDGWEEEAEVVAAAPRADVALIRLKHVPENLQAVEFGDSDQVKTGDRIFVVGSPYGIEFSLTAGHISGRQVQSVFSPQADPIVQLQTDAAINQGNSGGPMFNMAGQVIGVVSHILTQSGGFEGLGFALSINTAQDILINQTAFWSGVEFYPIAGPLAQALNIPQGSGLLVQRVALNAPAQRLGIRPGKIPVKVGNEEFFIGGDMVTAINGLIVDPADAEQMYKIRQTVNQLPKGGRIEVEAIRAGKSIILSTTK